MSSNVTTIADGSQTLGADSGLSSELSLPSASSFSEREDLPQTPFISVVVPVRNEAQCIEHGLNQLLAQDYPADRFEIIVADGESTDETVLLASRIAERRKNIRLYSNPRRWSSAGRNIGMRHARGDIVVVVDGHCELADDQFLRNLADAFCTTAADCVGRPQPQDISDANAFQCAVAAARSSRLGHHPDSHIYSSEERFVPAISVGVAYRRHVFEQLGGFDERFDACEDVEFNYRADRAGFRCYFTPSVAVHYRPRGNLLGLFRQLARYGRGRVRLFRKHPETFSVKSFLPGLFVVGSIVGLGLSLASRWVGMFYLGVLFAYVFAVLGTSVAVSIREKKLSILPWLPLVFATIHFGAGFGVVREMIGGTSITRASDASGHVSES